MEKESKLHCTQTTQNKTQNRPKETTEFLFRSVFHSQAFIVFSAFDVLQRILTFQCEVKLTKADSKLAHWMNKQLHAEKF